MKKQLVLFGTIAAFVLVADGLTMVLSESTSKIAGMAALLVGCGWLVLAVPRLVDPEVRPFLRVLLPKLGALVLPILFLPVYGLWLIATPSALSIGFTAAWASLWLACLVATLIISCPRCGGAYGRSGARIRPLTRVCAQCGVGPGASTD